MSVWADPECRASDDTNGSNKSSLVSSRLNAEYAMLLERKKSSYLLSIISGLSDDCENLKSILSICKHHMPRWETDGAFSAESDDTEYRMVSYARFHMLFGFRPASGRGISAL